MNWALRNTALATINDSVRCAPATSRKVTGTATFGLTAADGLLALFEAVVRPYVAKNDHRHDQ